MEQIPMPQLEAGTAKVSITPYVGAWMAGFAARDHGSEGIHDDLFARAVVLRAGDAIVGLVGCDLIGLSPDSVARIRERVEAESGIPADCVMVACTHTHSGPTVGPLRHPGLDPELVHVTERKTAGAVIAASRSTRQAALGAGKGATTIGINRRERHQNGAMRLGRDPGGPVDPELGVLRVDGPDRRPLAIAVTHSCHPVVLGGSNYFISADWPGQASALVERVYPGAVCPFWQGTCGDINSDPVGRTFEDARRLGALAGAEAIQVAEAIETTGDVELAVKSIVVDAPLAELPSIDEMLEIIQRRGEFLRRELAEGRISQVRHDHDLELLWAHDVIAEHERGEPRTTRPLELQALRLGEALLITTPGETFVEIGLAIKAASPLEKTFVLGYANGNVGYIQTAAAFAEGGYEVDSAYRFYGIYNFAPGVEKVVTGAGCALAREMAEEEQKAKGKGQRSKGKSEEEEQEEEQEREGADASER
jgi:hypothetical protein